MSARTNAARYATLNMEAEIFVELFNEQSGRIHSNSVSIAAPCKSTNFPSNRAV